MRRFDKPFTNYQLLNVLPYRLMNSYKIKNMRLCLWKYYALFVAYWFLRQPEKGSWYNHYSYHLMPLPLYILSCLCPKMCHWSLDKVIQHIANIFIVTERYSSGQQLLFNIGWLSQSLYLINFSELLPYEAWKQKSSWKTFERISYRNKGSKDRDYKHLEVRLRA